MTETTLTAPTAPTAPTPPAPPSPPPPPGAAGAPPPQPAPAGGVPPPSPYTPAGTPPPGPCPPPAASGPPRSPGSPSWLPPAAAFTQPPAAPPLPSRPAYAMTPADGVFALAALVLAFLVWGWLMPRTVTWSIPPGLDGYGEASATFVPGVGVTLVFAALLAAALAYFRARGVTLTAGARAAAVLLVAGALPFAVYDWTPALVPLFVTEALGLATWTAAGRAIARRPDADLAIDVVNQVLTVPARHAGSWGAALRSLAGRRKAAGGLLRALAGLALGLPVIALVLVLLMRSDDHFAAWMDRLAALTDGVDLGRWFWQLVLALPLAAFGFAALYATAAGSRRGVVEREGMDVFRAKLQRLAPALVAAPVALLCVLYLVFCAALGSYLFSALAGHLPDGWTYAGYARQGFFELAGVAAINLAVISFLRLFARRPDRLYPTVLRTLGALLSGLTVLLVVTAMSKMLLYIGAYGLTRLRLYVLVFMAVLLVVFALLTVWHIRLFAVSRALVPLALAAVLALGWANPDGIIARWNTDHYLSGDLAAIDVTHLIGLSAAADPALADLAALAPEAAVRDQASSALSGHTSDRTYAPWTAWTWQAWRADRLGRS